MSACFAALTSAWEIFCMIQCYSVLCGVLASIMQKFGFQKHFKNFKKLLIDIKIEEH